MRLEYDEIHREIYDADDDLTVARDVDEDVAQQLLRNEINSRFAIKFGVWFAFYVFAEILVAHVSPWVFPVLFALFLIPELWGAIRKEGGDTASEAVWVFVQKKLARQILAGAVGLAVAYRFATMSMLVSGSTDPFVLYGPTVLMGIGLAGWLVLHFPFLGKLGVLALLSGCFVDSGPYDCRFQSTDSVIQEQADSLCAREPEWPKNIPRRRH